MGPGGRIDPVWGLMTLYTIAEVLIISLLVMPMPSNALRGKIQGAVSRLWHGQEYVKKTSWVLLTLNSYYFYDAMHNLLEANKIVAATCESHQQHLYFQRNAMISGGSVFLFFVMRRLLDIQGQLYSMRALAKEAAGQQQQLLLTAGSAGDEQQRLLSKTLTRMARSSVDDGEPVPVGTKRD